MKNDILLLTTLVVLICSFSYSQTDTMITGTSVANITVEMKSDPDTITDSSQQKTITQSVVKQGDTCALPYFMPCEAIKISVIPDSTLFLNGFYKVDQEGNVNLPLMGLVSVKNMNKDQFVSQLKNGYVDYLRYPNLDVTPLIRVSFFGGFAKPGLYWVDAKSSLWDVIQIAGGVTREDGLKKIRWERNGEVLSKNVIEQFQSGVSIQSFGFKSGDQLCVTARPKQQFWEAFRQEALPIISLTLSTLTTAVTAYQAYKIYIKE